jgi:vacuolar-type H+-ATPase subunit H
MEEKEQAKKLLDEARKGLDGIYESTLRIFEVPYDEKTKKPLPRDKPLSSEEHDRIVERVQNRISTLRKKTKQIQTELNMSHDDLMNFIENPNNFTPEQWEILQEMRSRLNEYRGQVVNALEGGSNDVPPSNNKQKMGYKKRAKRGKWLQG